MARRFKMSRKKSRKLFTRTARKVSKKNFQNQIMRGGYRL
nr:MAG: hypothetical protein [Microvirus sp.]